METMDVPEGLEMILNPIKLKELAQLWINEDLPSFDFQGLAVGDVPIKANIFCKEPAVLAGKPFVDAVFRELGCTAPKWLVPEGTTIPVASNDNRIVVAEVNGPARLILMAERIILNVLARCSGVATKTGQIRRQLNLLQWRGQLVGTRKTTPGFRMVEKYGLLIGNGGTHRYDMSSMIMFKDNHVKISENSIDSLIWRVKYRSGFSIMIEVECSDLDNAIVACENGADVIMLDNLKPDLVKSYSKILKEKFPRILIEASGGINETNVNEYAMETVDIISMSSLIQGYPCIDFSMKVI